MPNFDDFERLVRRAMVARENDMSDFAARFNAIPTANRPRLFKAKSESEFAAWLTRSRNCLRTLYDAEKFRTSNRNAVGADITVLESGLQIELKTGAVTDANLGVHYRLGNGRQKRKQGTARYNGWPGDAKATEPCPKRQGY